MTDHLCHDLNTSLTAIHARAHLLGRAIHRASALGEDERAMMLVSVTAIEGAVREMVPLIDRLRVTGSVDTLDPG